MHLNLPPFVSFENQLVYGGANDLSVRFQHDNDESLMMAYAGLELLNELKKKGILLGLVELQLQVVYPPSRNDTLAC